MAEEYKLKRAVIAGAAHALKYKNKHIRATDQEILQDVTINSPDILAKMEEDE